MTPEDERNPWLSLSSHEVYENNWIRVREDAVVGPDGNDGIYGVVEFKNKAVGVLAYESGEICLVGQYRYPQQKYSWEIPEGGCPIDEEPLIAAQRELMEETGLVAKNWMLLGSSSLSNSVSDEVAFWYLATNLSQGPHKREGTEVLKVTKVTLKRAIEMVFSGEIDDAISMLAIMQITLILKDPVLGREIASQLGQ
jgi:8-oxo-dGTP pyrophosphatase MutT (NUDIX family)